MIISIGPQRYEVGVNIEIKPLRNEPAEVILISGDAPARKRRIRDPAK